MTKFLSLIGTLSLTSTTTYAFVTQPIQSINPTNNGISLASSLPSLSSPAPLVSPAALRRAPSATTCHAKLEGREIEGVLTPTNNFVLVKVADVEDQTSGGILLTGSAKIKKTEGLVLSTGPGKTHQESGLFFPMPVQPGESVIYGKYDGTEIDYDDGTISGKCTLIRDDDILVKFSNSGDSGDNELTIDTAEVISDNLLIRPTSEDEASSPSGLLLASTSTKGSKPSTGTVVKVGPGRMAANGDIMKIDIEVGDMVKFRDFAGNDVGIGGEEFCVVRMGDVLAKF